MWFFMYIFPKRPIMKYPLVYYKKALQYNGDVSVTRGNIGRIYLIVVILKISTYRLSEPEDI